jgi:hypothetical protein
MGCCNGKVLDAISEKLAEKNAQLKGFAADLKDDWAEYNLARRAKGISLDDDIMSSKASMMKLEDAIDGAAMLYSLWSSHKTDLLQLPSLSRAATAKPFIGGEAAARSIQEAATQQVELAALQQEWRKETAQCCELLGEGKRSLREGNAACNAYIEAEISSAAALKKYEEALAAVEKARSAVEAAETAAARAAAAATAAGGAPGGESREAKALAAKKDALAKKESAVDVPKRAREAAEAEL